MRCAGTAIALISWIACSVAGAAAQGMDPPQVTYPELPRQAQSATGFVPPGWILEHQVTGDLNRDQRPDLVLVLRQNDPRNVVHYDRLGETPLNTNPRILAVAFGSGEGYALVLQNHTLIPRRTDPVLEDPLAETGGIGIARGSLRVRLHFFASAGARTAATKTFIFRHQDGRFELIGYDRSSVDRFSGSASDLSVNYMTGRARLSSGSIESDASTVRWITLPHRPRLTISDIGNGLEFEPDIGD